MLMKNKFKFKDKIISLYEKLKINLNPTKESNQKKSLEFDCLYFDEMFLLKLNNEELSKVLLTLSKMELINFFNITVNYIKYDTFIERALNAGLVLIILLKYFVKSKDPQNDITFKVLLDVNLDNLKINLIKLLNQCGMDEKKMPDTQNQEKNLLADEKMEKKKDLILILLNIIAFLISIDFKVLKKSNLFAKCENKENEFGFFEKLKFFFLNLFSNEVNLFNTLLKLINIEYFFQNKSTNSLKVEIDDDDGSKKDYTIATMSLILSYFFSKNLRLKKYLNCDKNELLASNNCFSFFKIDFGTLNIILEVASECVIDLTCDFEEGSKKASSYSEYALSFIWKWKPNTVKSEEEELLEKMNTRKKNLPKEVLPIIFTDLFDVLSNITSEEKRQLKLDFLSYFQLYVNYFKCLLKNREKFKLSSLNLNYLKLFSYNLKYVTSEENILYLDSEDLEDDSLQLILKVEVEIINYNLMNFQVDLFKKDEEETETEKVTTDQVEDIVKKSEISSSNSINDISEEKVKKKFKCDKKFDFLVLKCFLMLNYFISFGDRFLSDPHHYDRLFYEIIRNADALKNLYNYIVKKMEQNLKENVNDNASFFSEQLKNFDNLNLIFNYFLPKLNDFQQEDLNETNILDMLKENYTNLNLIIFEDEDDCWSLYCEDVTASELDIIKNFGPVLSEFSF